MLSGQYEAALPLAERAVSDAKTCLPAHSFLAALLLRLGRVRDAQDVVARAITLDPGAAEAQDGLAYVATELGQHHDANALYRRATALAPGKSWAWYNLACSERSFGRLVAAEEACERAILIDAHQYRGVLLRSELRVQVAGANHVADLERRLANPKLDIHGRIFLGYALAKEFDDLHRFDDAFRCFAGAAKLRRSQFRYDIAADEHRMQRIAELFSDSSPGRLSHDEAPFIFIVGLPRSGTTLVERILTGLAGVRSNGETENFSRALSAAGSSTPVIDMVQRAAAADPAAVAACYAKLARPAAPGQRVVDKLPTNYLYVGAIRRALPAAKILLVRRQPLDSCFAMYRALFGDAYPFSYDFEELARYYAVYDKLMQHWLKEFGEAIHEVVYEELVRDPQRVGASIAAFCGLAWNPNATDIESNQSVSLTASAVQVRRPIYGTSSGRWRHYRTHLSPLIEALRRHGVTVPDDA